MIRRLELAQAMLHRPSVLFLDEPTIGLDPIARHAVWDRLREIRALGATTVLVTTHDMEEAEVLCETIGIMHEGRLAAIDTPDALKQQVGPGATLFSTFSCVIACLVKTRERFMGIGQVLTYLVNALRALMIQGGQSSAGLPTDFAVLFVLLVVLVVIGAWLYPGITR